MQSFLGRVRTIISIGLCIAGASWALELSPAETDFLRSKNRTLRIACPRSEPPLSHVASTGEFSGQLPNLFKWMGELADLQIEFVPIKNQQGQPELLRGQYDLLGSVFTSLPDIDSSTITFFPVPGGRYQSKQIYLGLPTGNRPLKSLLVRLMEESQRQHIAHQIRQSAGGELHTSLFGECHACRMWFAIGISGLLLTLLLFGFWDIRLSQRIRQKNRKLSGSEDQLRALFKNSPDAMYIVDEAGRIAEANAKACTQHKLTREELLGMEVLDLVPPERPEPIDRWLANWFSGELRRYESSSKGADGVARFVEVLGAPLHGTRQRTVLLQVRDLSKYKNVERALQESEARYQSLVELQNNLMIRLDPEGCFTFVNESFCRLVGHPQHELIGHHFHPYVYTEDLTGTQEAVDRILSARDRVIALELRSHTQTDIAWIHWEASAILDGEGRVSEVQAIGQNITERRKIHDALQESERRLHFLFEEIPHIAVQGYNASHQVIFWNRASERIYGYSRDEAMGKKVENLLTPPDQKENVVDAINHWRETGNAPPAGETIKRRADGSTMVVYSTYLSSSNGAGEREIYEVDIDLSELKRANRELIKAKQFAERANRAKSEFLANMSHEIRTPMNGVMGMTHLLLDTELDDEQQELAQTVLHSTMDLLSIINELLDISRIEAGEVHLQMAPFAPRDTVEKVVALFTNRARHKEVGLSVAIDSDVPEAMMGDAGRIRQVLINLVGNSLKFTDRGQIQIRMQSQLVNAGWKLMFDVQDSGIGMSPEFQKKMFEKFTQSDPSPARQHGGFGLGLAISKQLVELMGGTIRVVSQEGQGSTFSFYIILPNLETTPALPPEKEPEPIDAINLDAHILLVEDNRVNQKVAVAMIQKTGCRVSIAANGVEALQLLAQESFDLVFMDCQMPIMDGYEAARAIRQLASEVRDIPIVAMTAHALKEDRQKCIDAGMSDYLSKPIDKEKLFAMLQRFCAPARPEI